jgi:heme exporter protein D
MNWGSLSNFLEMGGYAFFVWGAYGVAAGLIAAELVALRARRRRVLVEVAQQARLADSGVAP